MSRLSGCERVRAMAEDQDEMPEEAFVSACGDLCEDGLLTCMRGSPGADDAWVVLTYLPLANPEQYSLEALARYRTNRKKIGLS